MSFQLTKMMKNGGDGVTPSRRTQRGLEVCSITSRIAKGLSFECFGTLGCEREEMKVRKVGWGVLFKTQAVRKVSFLIT